MAKFKHNKKRNTAFLYETLVLELTKALLRGDEDSKKEITILIKESFKYGTLLHKELKLYHSITKTKNVTSLTAEKILAEVKRARSAIDKKSLLSEQNKLGRKIKKILPAETMTNFVPSYKTLATIYQVFNAEVPISTRVLLENEIVGVMAATQKEKNKQKMVPIDNLVYNTFAKKFNQEYSDELLKEQKELLAKFVSSFSDNGLQLKTYLNEEVARLKGELKKSLLIKEFVSDKSMATKAKDVLSILDSYKTKPPGKEMVQQVIKIQSLVSEIKIDAAH
jgi:hypothetical protein|tara:strand:- start:3743 stop:4582 length:840 start_codon:yes stop_codon:yes gene_type:complete